MTEDERATLVEDCAAKVGSWSTVGRGSHEQRLAMQQLLTDVSEYLKARARAIRAGTVRGMYT